MRKAEFTACSFFIIVNFLTLVALFIKLVRKRKVAEDRVLAVQPCVHTLGEKVRKNVQMKA